ncbi:hypothetical protein AAY473_008665 [Plecturocebus cupreus]
MESLGWGALVKSELTATSASPVPMGSHYIAQAGLKLLGLCDPPTLDSQSAGITGVSHCTLSISAADNKHFGRLKRVGYLRSGVQDLKTGQHGKTLSILKIQNKSRKDKPENSEIEYLQGMDGPWMELEAIILSKLTQEQKTKYGIVLIVYQDKLRQVNIKHAHVCSLELKSLQWPGEVAHTCNPSTLGSRGGQIT